MRRLCIFNILMLSTVAMTGCGSADPGFGPMAGVKGSITCQGEPVESGIVYFMNSEKGFGGSARIYEPGKFATDAELPAGKYKVSIAPPPPADLTGRNLLPKITKDIPSKYRSFETSGLEVDVVSGENQIELALVK